MSFSYALLQQQRLPTCDTHDMDLRYLLFVTGYGLEISSDESRPVQKYITLTQKQNDMVKDADLTFFLQTRGPHLWSYSFGMNGRQYDISELYLYTKNRVAWNILMQLYPYKFHIFARYFMQ